MDSGPKQKHFFFTVLEAGESKIKALASSVSAGGLLKSCLSQMAVVSLCPYKAEGPRERTGFLL